MVRVVTVEVEQLRAALLEQARECAQYDNANGETTLWVLCALAERVGLGEMKGAIRRAYHLWCYRYG